MKVKISKSGISYGLFKFGVMEYLAIILIATFYIILILDFVGVI